MIQKTFKVGNSVVVTVPANKGIKPGTRVKFVEDVDEDKLVYELLEKSEDVEDVPVSNLDDLVKSITGVFEKPKSISTAELMETIKELEENPYDKSKRIS